MTMSSDLSSSLDIDEASGPTNFPSRGDYNEYLAGVINPTSKTHEAERQVFVQQLENRYIVKNTSPVEWTRHSQIVKEALRNDPADHKARLEAMKKKKDLNFDERGKLAPLKPLRKCKNGFGSRSCISANPTLKQCLESKRSWVFDGLDYVQQVHSSASSSNGTEFLSETGSVPNPANTGPKSLYAVGLEYISLLLRADPAKRKLLETLQPPEDLTNSLELLEVLTSGKPISTHSSRATLGKLVKGKRRSFLSGVRMTDTIRQMEVRDLSLAVVVLASSVASVAVMTPKNTESEKLEKEKEKDKFQANPLLTIFLHDLHSFTDISDTDLLTFLQGYMSLLPIDVINLSTCTQVENYLLQLQILGQTGDPTIEIRDFKSKVRQVGRTKEAPRQTVEQNLKRIAEGDRILSISFVKLLQSAMQPPQLNRTVKRVVSKIEKMMKTINESRGDRANQISEAHLLEIRAIFELASEGDTLTRDRFRNLVSSTSMSPEDTNIVFDTHLDEGSSEMTFENFVAILKELYPPYSNTPGESLEAKRDNGTNESILAVSKELRKTTVHRITLPSNVTSKSQQLRQSQRMERLAELTGRVKEMERLKDANRESLIQSTKHGGKGMYKTMLRSLLREAKMAEEMEKEPTPFVGGVLLD